MAKEGKENEVSRKEEAAVTEQVSQPEEAPAAQEPELYSEEGLTLEKFEEASEVVKRVTSETKLVFSEYLSAQTGNKDRKSVV